jgi:hypothetical protein
MFIAAAINHAFSSVRSGIPGVVEMPLLTELGMKQYQFYKHCAPNGARELLRNTLSLLAGKHSSLSVD